MTEVSIPEPKQPSIGKFEMYELLVALYACWESVRGDKMLPSKRDFEGEMLNSPEFLSEMAFVEQDPNGELHYRYIGSQIVTRRDSDQTGKPVTGVHEPKVEKLVLDWGFANFKMPHILFYTTRTHLPSGAIGDSFNLVVPLANHQGLSPCLAVATVVDDVFRQEFKKGGFLAGSAGVEMNPIDIGYGVPNLPRTVHWSTLNLCRRGLGN